MTVKPPSIGYGPLYSLVILLFLYTVAKFLINLYRVRIMMTRFKKQGLVSTKAIQ